MMPVMKATALLVLLALARAAAAQNITITTAEDIRQARSITIRKADGKSLLDYVDTNGRAETLRAADVVEIAFPGPASPPTPAIDLVELVTTAGDSIVGTLVASDENALTLDGSALGKSAFKTEQIDQVRFPGNRSTWPKRPPGKRDNDSIFTTSGDQRQGSFRSAGRDGIVIHSSKLDRDVRIGLSETASVYFMAVGAAPAKPATLYTVAILSDGSTLQGTIDSMGDGVVKMTDFYGQARSLSSAAIASLYFKNGRVVYLSDLGVAKAVENPNFIRLSTPLPSDLVLPYQRDRNVREKPLRIRGQVFQKGIGVHARSELTWTLDGKFSKFHATIGIDDAANDASGGSEIGNVTFIVMADGVKLLDSGPVTAKDKPRPVVLPIDGKKELTLIVEFGDDQSGQGDLADWALARVIQ